MMDATNVGISPLMTTPMTSYATTTPVETTAFSQPMIYGQTSIPATTSFQPQVIPQGFALPTTTTAIPEATASYFTQPMTTTTNIVPEAMTSFVPQTTLPDPTISASFIPTDIQNIPVLPDPNAQTLISSTPVAVSTPETILPPPTTEIVQPTSVTTMTQSTPVPVPYASTTVGQTLPPTPSNLTNGPIMDEDFQRGRPIYDVVNEEKYKRFKFGR